MRRMDLRGLMAWVGISGSCSESLIFRGVLKNILSKTCTNTILFIDQSGHQGSLCDL